jgi:hypothetical protein
LIIETLREQINCTQGEVCPGVFAVREDCGRRGALGDRRCGRHGLPTHMGAKGVSLYEAFFVKDVGGFGASFPFVGFFVRSESLFLCPDPRSLTSARAGAVRVGRRTDLAAYSALGQPTP